MIRRFRLVFLKHTPADPQRHAHRGILDLLCGRGSRLAPTDHAGSHWRPDHLGLQQLNFAL